MVLISYIFICLDYDILRRLSGAYPEEARLEAERLQKEKALAKQLAATPVSGSLRRSQQ
jgi:hypothetical protein